MRIQILSDIHTEFHRDNGQSFCRGLRPTGVDVLLVAGDLGTVLTVGPALDYLCPLYPVVIFVAGNHEFYLGSPDALRDRLEQAQQRHPNLHWLENDTITLGSQRFVGTTLWFPGTAAARALRGMLNDYNSILDFEPWVYDQHSRAVSFLERTIIPTDVVITHHAPSTRSIAPQYVGSPINVYFACDLDRLLNRGPRLWIHGHMHDSLDYKIRKTRVICNPFGYAGAGVNAGFRESLVLDL